MIVLLMFLPNGDVDAKKKLAHTYILSLCIDHGSDFMLKEILF